MKDLALLQVVGLYLGAGGLAIGGTIILLCGVLRLFTWSPGLAKWISRILTFLGLLTATAITCGFGVWIWVDNFSKLPQRDLSPSLHQQVTTPSITLQL